MDYLQFSFEIPLTSSTLCCCEARIERERERETYLSMVQRKIPLFFLQFTLHVWSFLDMREMAQVIDFLCAHFRQCCKQRAVSWAWKDQSISRAHDILIFPCSIPLSSLQILLLMRLSSVNYISRFNFHRNNFFSRIIFRKTIHFQLLSSKMISNVPINFLIY